MKVLLSFVLVMLCFSYSFASKELIDKFVSWKKVQIIKVVLDWTTQIITSVSTWWDSFENLVKNVWWDTGINWAYFCPADYPQCNWENSTTSDRVYKWEVFSKYWKDLGARWLFGFDQSWSPLFILNNLWYVEWINKKYNDDKLDQVYYGISNHPVLLLEWENVLSESENLIESKLSSKTSKSFICSTKDNKKIYMGVVQNSTIYELPDFLKINFDCYYAINLDNGGSQWLIYDWKLYKKPWRKIMDAFVVLDWLQLKLYQQSEKKKIISDIEKLISQKNNEWKIHQWNILNIRTKLQNIISSKDAELQKLINVKTTILEI